MEFVPGSEVKKAWKYIVQIRAQLSKRRVSLVVGAGVSRALELPMWGSLLDKIRQQIASLAPEVAGVESDSLGKLALVLFEFYRSSRIDSLLREDVYSESHVAEKKILAEWRGMIHAALYEGTQDSTRREVVNRHPYLLSMIEVVKKSEVTVNYNFDDYIEYCLTQKDINPVENERPYQTVWSHNSQFTKDCCVIYHPNGFLPFDNRKFQSEGLIFSEGAFADQLLDGISGSLSTLLHLITKRTCILIGHSLTDSTLCHLLRKGVSISPGNYSYFVRYTTGDVSPAERDAVFKANFNNYNLVTLFFNDSDIDDFLKIISMGDAEFAEISDRLGLPIKYVYYLVGSIAAGKSTALSQFGSLTTLDEWFDERPMDMAKSPEALSTGSTIVVDDWANAQFRKKNAYLIGKNEGVFVVDRAPLDPLAFVVKVTRRDRAISLIKKAIRPGKSSHKVVSGEVILMCGDEREIWSRLINKRKEGDWGVERIRALKVDNEEIYGPLNPHRVVATGRKESEVIRDIAKIIYSADYSPVDLDARLCEIANEVE